jgi:predicted membrane protein
MSFFSNFIRIIFEFKTLILAIFLIFIMNLMINIKKKRKKLNDDFIKFEAMSPEEKKIFLITKFNTTINRNDPIEREKFIKNCKFFIFNKL